MSTDANALNLEVEPDGHGTYAGFQTHVREHTEPCESCRLARNEYTRDLRKTKPEILKRQRRAQKRRQTALYELERRHPEEYARIWSDIGPQQVQTRRKASC